MTSSLPAVRPQTRQRALHPVSLPSRHQQKSPHTEMTSAAGKYLIKMDLPLARREPSPPYRLREALRLARRCPIALPKPRRARPLLAEATRARFQFVGHTHRREFTLKISVITETYRFQPQNGAIAVPFRSCKCSDKPGLLQSQAENGVASDFFDFFLSAGYFLAAKSMS